MKLVVRVQYIGERARLLLREDLAAEYTKGLIDDLEVFGFPVPHEQKPIEKSGFMLCVWHVERDSDTHRIIQNAFMKAKAEAASLMDRSIRYISLNEDGVMHTTSLAHKPYKPKTYTKPTFGNYQVQDIKPFGIGKAPKYPSSISQARRGITPLSQRIAGIDPSDYNGGSSGHYDCSSRDFEMRASDTYTPPPASGSEASSNSVIGVAQQTLLQLSQSSAFQSLMQRGPPTPNPVKLEPEPPPDLSSLPPRPTLGPSTQTQIPNLQALLEKAGVKSASAQAFVSSQNGLPPKPSPYASGTNSAPLSGANGTPIPSTPSSLSSSSLGTKLSLPPATSSVSSLTSLSSSPNVHPSKSVGISVSRSHSTAPAPPPPRGPGAHALTRELWGVRRQIAALQAQESDFESELRRLGQPVPPKESTNSFASEQRVKALEDEIAALREELNREQQTRRVQEALLRAERLRRSELESMVKDTTRECKQPFVVPALLDAFMKIGQMTGDALKDSHGATVPMEL